MVKSEEVVYKKSKYNLPPSKSSKKSKGAIKSPYKTPKTNEGEKAVKNNPYLESPKAGVKKLLKQISRVQEPVTGVTTFKKLGDEEFKLGCLKGYNFCIAGILHTSIEETKVITLPEFCNIIKTLGGKITSQVDNSTDYLVLGSLEDGRAVNESSRYIKAKKRNKIWEENGVGFPIQFVKGIDEFSGLLRSMSESERIRYESYF
jgi:BRCT domain type II-containing protein